MAEKVESLLISTEDAVAKMRLPFGQDLPFRTYADVVLSKLPQDLQEKCKTSAKFYPKVENKKQFVKFLMEMVRDFRWPNEHGHRRLKN